MTIDKGPWFFGSIDIYVPLPRNKLWGFPPKGEENAFNVHGHLKSVRARLEKEGTRILSDELSRYLPQVVFTSYQTVFNDIIIHITQLINQKSQRG